MWTWRFHFINSIQTERVTFPESFVKLGGRDPPRLEDTPATDTRVPSGQDAGRGAGQSQELRRPSCINSHLSLQFNNAVLIVTCEFPALLPIIGYKSFVYGGHLRLRDALPWNRASGCTLIAIFSANQSAQSRDPGVI